MPRNALTLFLAGAMAIGFLNLLNLIQPLLLGEMLGMTSGEGDFTANLYILTEITTLLIAAPLANLSDITGRRPILSAGFLIICITMLAIPTATTEVEYMAIRVAQAIGIASCTTMIASLAADYPQNPSRGKFIGLHGVCTAIGVIVIGSGMTQLPRLFMSSGYSMQESINHTLWIAGGLAIIAMFITFGGIRKGIATDNRQKDDSFFKNARAALKEIKGNQRLILGCGATAISRGDLTVLASFFALWVQKTGTDSGVESVVASATAGKLFGLTQVAMLIAMPVIAVLADKLDRLNNLLLGVSLAALGYFALAWSPDPFNSPWIYLVILIAGVGEAAMIISVPTLIGQEAPAHVRGAIIGVAASFGAFGIIVTNKVSGYLFDNWDYQAPFMFMALLNSCMLIWALTVRLLAPKPVAARAV